MGEAAGGSQRPPDYFYAGGANDIRETLDGELGLGLGHALDPVDIAGSGGPEIPSAAEASAPAVADVAGTSAAGAGNVDQPQVEWDWEGTFPDLMDVDDAADAAGGFGALLHGNGGLALQRFTANARPWAAGASSPSLGSEVAFSAAMAELEGQLGD